jgi:hypothetical protein
VRHKINGQTSLIKLLQEHTNTLPLIARQFSYQTGAVRHFSVKFVDPENLESLSQHGTDSDGVIWYIVASNAEEIDKAHTYVVHTESAPHHIFVLPGKAHALRDLLLDVASLRWILEYQPELESDRVARRELSARLAESEQLVTGAISHSYGPISAQWFWQGKEVLLHTSRDVDHLLSNVCELLFPYTPRIWNELIVRRQLSAMASKARRNLVEAMLEHGSEETLAITGFPAERAIYESVLCATGIHRYDGEGKWYFGPPSQKDPGALQPVWNAIQQFFESSTDHPRALSDLYTLLEAPPFGVKAGLTPLLFVAAYVANIGEIALYEYGNFAPIPDMALFERLLRQPTNFGIRLSRASGLRVAVYERLARALAPSALGKTFQPAVMDAITPLLRIVRKLPDYTRQTTSVSKQAQAVRAAVLSARSPDEMLFHALPQACGLPPILVDQSLDDTLVEHFFTSLRSSLEELQGSYEVLILEIQRLIGEAFKAQARDSQFLRDELLYRYNLFASTISEPIFRSLGIRIENAEGGSAWIESVAALVSRKPADTWNDQDLSAFKNQIADLGHRFRSMEQVAVTSQSLPKNASVIHVGITDSRGEQSVVLHRLEFSQDQQQLRNEINQLLDRYSTLSLQQQTVVLTELLQQLLSSGEES